MLYKYIEPNQMVVFSFEIRLSFGWPDAAPEPTKMAIGARALGVCFVVAMLIFEK